MPALQAERESFSLAAGLELSENSRQGFGGKNAASYLDYSLCNSPTALGIEREFSASEIEKMRRSCFKNCIGSRIQTWNRYAYVLNNPLSYIDPLGLDCGQPTPQAPDNGGYTITVTAECPSWYTFVVQGLPQYLYCAWTGSCSPYPPGGGGSGGAVVSAQPKPKPQPQTTNGAAISSAGKFHCASAIADRLSLANQPSLPGPSNPTMLDKAVAYAGNAVFGNTISGIVQFADTARTAANPAPVFWGLFNNGLRLGVPGGGVMSQGAVGVAQDTVLQSAFANLGVSASQ